MKKALFDFKNLLIIVFVILLLISPCSNSISINNKDSEFKEKSLRTNNFEISSPFNEYMYGYIVNSSKYDEGTCYFYIDDPGTIEFFHETESDDFLSGGTYGGQGYWYACENSTGALWQIDPYFGDMFYIGGGGVGLNSLAYDSNSYSMYGGSGSDLYKIDFYDGSQEYIGQFGSNINEMIGMSFDADGILYGWDLEYDKLWVINTETGEATEIGSLGIDLNNAQDGDFDLETDTLYLTAFTDKGQLYECDKETGECLIIGDFDGNSQITASFITFRYVPNYDIGITKIVKPNNGYANDEMDVVVQVKNYGLSLYDIPINVKIIKESDFLEYNKTVYIEEIHWNEDIEVHFPKWTPVDWQEEYDRYFNYNITAHVTTWPDINPYNDFKEKDFELYFPWSHDIEINSINSPSKSGPGKTYPVNATIKNVGQYNENSIHIEINIGKSLDLSSLLLQEDWENFPPDGWYDEHKDIGSQYGWDKTDSSYSGGSSPEIFISNDSCLENIHLYSYPIDISNYSLLSLQFKSYIDHNEGNGQYSLKAGLSTDGEKWYTVWHEKPRLSRKYDVNVPIDAEIDEIFIGFWVTGDPYCFNNWYIDDVELVVTSIDEEYYDYTYLDFDIEPGEKVTFEFDDWTPDFLQNETTGNKDYIIACKVELDGDVNPGNDIKSEFFTLKFWHDVGIDEITSPVGKGHLRSRDEILWDNGEPDGRNALPGSMYNGYSNILIDDFYTNENWVISGGNIYLLWDSGYTFNLDSIRLYFYEEQGNCDPSIEEYPEEGYYIEANVFDEYVTGNEYFGRPEILVEFLLDGLIEIPAGYWYVGIQPIGIIDDFAYLLTSESKGCEVMADLPYWIYPRWTSSNEIWGEYYDLSWQLETIIPGYYIDTYVKPGIYNISAIVKNCGTFPKYNLTCFAEIWEYINFPYNKIKVYENQIDEIDLTLPLGGNKALEFNDFNFTADKYYELTFKLPANPDDKQINNEKNWKIGVDNTKPISGYPPLLNPPNPDGLNGWYVSDVTVTLNATDPWNHVRSGVKEIRYTINGGEERVINGSYGRFDLTEEGKDILLEYWAVDWVGNIEEPKNSYTIDIDKTPPEISFTYEVVGGNKWQGWDFEFTATAIDTLSGMDRVEFYLNYELQETVEGNGPEYVWTINYWPLPYAIFSATAYDNAGLYSSDEIINPTTISHSKLKINQKFSKKSDYPWLLNLRNFNIS